MTIPEGDAASRFEARIEAVIGDASAWLMDRRAQGGHWSFELEADVTIPAEYILLNHYLGQPDDEIEKKLSAYIRATQGDHGGWPLFYDGGFNISASVKAYYALKMAGEDSDAPHMKKAREAILAHGGAARANIFTRITLALFGQVPWRAVPVTRVETMLLPRWFPVHINKVSYWTRTVTVPLLILTSLRKQARNPRGVGIEELFVTPPDQEKHYLTNASGHWLGNVMLVLDRIAFGLISLIPNMLQRRAITKAMDFISHRLNGEHGLGAIFPAMANAVMAMDALDYPPDNPDLVAARKALESLLVVDDEKAYCQPCVSPVWDTGLASHALMEVAASECEPAIAGAAKWLVDRQVLDLEGDWSFWRKDLRPGGWAFQYQNDYYPDVDDTSVVVMALHRVDADAYAQAIERGTEWVLGMQSGNGGWASFDADNDYYLLQHLPFADHGALLDPPTADVSARCISMLAQVGYGPDHGAMARGLEFLKREQEEDGSWFGRWGTNYIYGTWSVLCALNAAGVGPDDADVQKAVAWLKSFQRPDGGWGEDCATYWPERRGEVKASDPSQTAWALLGLMAAGEVESDSVQRGIAYLLDAPRDGGDWQEDHFNAVGFPRVFYLRYHGYPAYFPLWALARYRNLKNGGGVRPEYGM